MAFEELSSRQMLAALVAVSEIENNDSAAASQQLVGPTGFVVTGDVSSVNDVDSYSLTAIAGMRLQVTAKASVRTGSAATEFAPRLTVYAPDGSVIATSVTTGVGPRRAAAFGFFAAVGGMYRVVIAGRQQGEGLGSLTGGYVLKIGKTTPVLAPKVAPVEANVLTRLAIYQPASAAPSVSDWQPVNVGDSRLTGKNVYVVVHGWATDYANVPRLNGTPDNPLKWWQTIDYSKLTPAKNPFTGKPIPLTEPVAAYMFLPQAGENPDKTAVTPAGLAWQLLQSDPNAVVIAYSWVDDSATVLPGPSQSRTTLNGARLATALGQALPADAAAGLHLIGHSHGSKVAAVAATILRHRGLTANQLTILDSPEQSASVTDFNATNNLWYFLSALNVDRNQTPGTTFVDNYISQLDRQLGLIQGYDPYANDAVKVSVLQQVADVRLQPKPLLPARPKSTDPFAHRYAPAWYAGGSAAWAGNVHPTVANQWSSLVINPSVSRPIAANSSQSWQTATQPQFALTPGQSGNTPTFDPQPSLLALRPVSVPFQPPPPKFDGTVTLSGNGHGETVTKSYTFTTPKIMSGGSFGISFNLQFSEFELDDQLRITVNTGSSVAQQQVFVMTAKQLGTTPGLATLSLGSIARNPGVLNIKRIDFSVIPSAGSQGRTTASITNIKQFIVPAGA